MFIYKQKNLTGAKPWNFNKKYNLSTIFFSFLHCATFEGNDGFSK